MNRFAAFATAFTFALGLSSPSGAQLGDALRPDQRTFETQQHMVLYFGGLRIGHMSLTAKVRNGHYAMTTHLEAGGAARLFTNSSVFGTATGTITETGTLSPQHYQYMMSSGDEHLRTTKMEFQKDGAIQFTSEPAYEKQTAPVPLEQQKTSLDPLSAGLFNLSFAPDGKLCEGTVKVYDGRRRYDLHLELAGEDQLSSRRDERYSGPAIKCTLVYERHKSFDEAVPVSKRSKSYEPMTLWFAAFPAPDGGDDIYMPVKLLAHSDYGAFVAHSEDRSVKPLTEALNQSTN